MPEDQGVLGEHFQSYVAFAAGLRVFHRAHGKTNCALFIENARSTARFEPAAHGRHLGGFTTLLKRSLVSFKSGLGER